MIKSSIDKLILGSQRALPVVLVGLVLAGCSRVEREGAPDSKTSAETQKVQDERTALDDYVAAPDTNYSYRLVNTIRGNDQTTYILDMTSQAWLTTNEVDRPLWKHWMNIVRPDTPAAAMAATRPNPPMGT